MRVSRRQLIIGTGTSIIAPWSLHSAAQDVWPSKAVKIINPWPTGGAADGLIRPIAESLQSTFGQPFLVESLSGANGTIGTAAVARAPKDGYTLLFSHLGPMTVSPALTKLSYDPVKDFMPVTQLTTSPLVLLVRNGLPPRTLAEFFAYAKAQTKPLSMGSVGNGSTTHIAAEMMRMATGIPYLHIPYKGSEPALFDMGGGRVDYSFLNYMGALAHVQAGRVRVLGVTSAKRTTLLPDIPAIAEIIPGYEMAAWYGMHAPSGTSPAIVTKLHDAVVKLLRTPESLDRLHKGGFDSEGTSPTEFGTKIQNDIVKFSKLVAETGMTTS